MLSSIHLSWLYHGRQRLYVFSLKFFKRLVFITNENGRKRDATKPIEKANRVRSFSSNTLLTLLPRLFSIGTARRNLTNAEFTASTRLRSLKFFQCNTILLHFIIIITSNILPGVSFIHHMRRFFTVWNMFIKKFLWTSSLLLSTGVDNVLYLWKQKQKS